MIPILVLFGLASLASIVFVVYYPVYVYATDVKDPTNNYVFNQIIDLFGKWLAGWIITGK